MDNYPESADMSLVLDYPEYQPSEELEQAFDDLAFMKENAVEEYGNNPIIDQWEQEQRERLESADFWGNALYI